jgi:hypothetical protein
LQSRGLTAGGNTVTDDLMQTVGLDNLAARYGIKTHQPSNWNCCSLRRPICFGRRGSGADGTQAARVQHRALRRSPSAGTSRASCTAPGRRSSRKPPRSRVHAMRSMQRLARRLHDEYATLDPPMLALVLLLAIASIVVGRIVLGWNVWLDRTRSVARSCWSCDCRAPCSVS